MITNEQKGGLVRKDAEIYVGGRTVFAALQREWPSIVKPFYLTTKRAVFRREDLDEALLRASKADKPLTNK